jgi:hypothetical protein
MKKALYIFLLLPGFGIAMELSKLDKQRQTIVKDMSAGSEAFNYHDNAATQYYEAIKKLINDPENITHAQTHFEKTLKDVEENKKRIDTFSVITYRLQQAKKASLPLLLLGASLFAGAKAIRDVNSNNLSIGEIGLGSVSVLGVFGSTYLIKKPTINMLRAEDRIKNKKKISEEIYTYLQTKKTELFTQAPQQQQ